MARPRKNPEAPQAESVAIAVSLGAPMRNYSDLFNKISALQGPAKRDFCKTLTPDEKRAYISHLKDQDCEMVTGLFRCFEPLGGMLEMTAKAYEHEVPTKYVFLDGQRYTIPKYIAKRFESEFQGSGTFYPTHGHIQDADGKPIIAITKRTRRFGFSSLDFQ